MTENNVATVTSVIEGQSAGEVVSGNPDRLIALALDKGADPDTLKRLMDLHERWETNQARKAYVVAMTAFKQEAPAVLKKGDKVEFSTAKGRTSYNYANLGSIVQEITAILGKHELSASWQTQQDKELITVTCHVTHIAGHRESVTLTGPADESGNKNRIQAVGSTVTYLQRYTLLAALGLATGEDDDGQGGKTVSPPQAKSKKPELSELSPAHISLLALLTETYDTQEKQAEALYTLTTWEKDGIRHDGKRSLYDISEKMANVAYGKLKELLKEVGELDDA